MKKKTWIVVASTVAVLAFAAATFAARIERIRERSNVIKSKDNMMTIVTLFLTEGPVGPPPAGGKRLPLWLVANGRIDPRNPKNLDIFFSPADEDLALEKIGAAAYSGLTEARLRDPATDVRRLTSYAGRRVGLAPPTGGRYPLLADLSFRDRGIVLIALSDRRVEEMTREDLGLGPDDPIVVGPHSRSPLLAQLSDE